MSRAQAQAYLDEGFELTDDDVKAIQQAASLTDKWGDEGLKPFRDRIKAYHRKRQGERCCYCQRSFVGEFSFVIDIEHVLPKKRFPSLCFNVRNLSVACKRCNMDIKRARIDFLTCDLDAAAERYDQSSTYKLIHPNIDLSREHLVRAHLDSGESQVTFYGVKNDSAKGRFTKEYFRLREFEEESIDKSQGLVERFSEGYEEILRQLEEVGP